MTRTGARGGAAGAWLPVFVTAVMFGLVMVANADRYGAAGAVLGGVIAVAGVGACRARFASRTTATRTSERGEPPT